MKRITLYVAAVACSAAMSFLAPASRAQSVGRVECPRSDGYVYLYSSLTTLEVRSTLQCGEQVQITGRFDKYFGVRTTKGDVGFVPLAAVLLIKDAEGPRAPQPPPPPSRERIMYDQPAPAPPTPKVEVSPSEFILRSGTVVHLKLVKGLSSASAKLGDHVDLEVTEDVVVDGLSVVPKGAAALGSVTDVEAKKHMGHGGKVGVSLNSVRLSNGENAPVRGYQEAKAGNSTTGTVLPLVSGKDVAFAPGTDFTGWVDGDVHLKKEAFAPAGPDAAAAASVQPASPGHK
jgi:hypothetical protein